MIGIYRNAMETDAQRGQMRQGSRASTATAAAPAGLRILGRQATRECIYRTPVVGRDLEIVATARLLSGTPKRSSASAFLAVNLRTGGGANYQLAVFPLQRKAQLRKVLPDGKVEFLRSARARRRIKGTNQANELRLRAFNLTGGPATGTIAACSSTSATSGSPTSPTPRPAICRAAARASRSARSAQRQRRRGAASTTS